MWQHLPIDSGLPLAYDALALTGIVTWLKSKGVNVWTFEAVAYIYLVTKFYWRSFIVVEELSKRYKDVLGGVPSRQSGLHPSWLSGWLNGRPMDLKDAQYHEFRDSLSMLVWVIGGYLAGAFAVRFATSSWSRRGRVVARASFIALFGIAASVVFHEADTIKILALSLGNFFLCQATVRSGRVAPILLWTYNLGVLYLNDVYHGFKFVSLLGDGDRTRWLDTKSGELAWHHSFNFVMLRMTSFNMDYWWKLQAEEAKNDDKDGGERKEKPKTSASLIWKKDKDEELTTLANFHEESELEESARVRNYHPAFVYNNLAIYYAYLLYLPLYIAGPTITFNSFVSYLAVPQRTYSALGKLRYAARFFATMLLFEVLTHFLYVGAISFMAFRHKIREIDPSTNAIRYTPLLIYLTRTTEAGDALDYEQIVYYSYWALMYLWFKFLLIWRLFRLWAVCDDVEPVENMERCMNNNYTIGGFWRAWHRSFNRWLVRYIYIPLGGKSISPLRKAVNILIVFTFVGYWHDLKPELFAWGWLLSLFFVPEILAELVSRTAAFRGFATQHPLAASWVTAFCGACNIIMLKVANIVGYTTGLQGAALLVPALQTKGGAWFAAEYLLFMTIGVQIMFFIRDARGETLSDRKRI